VYFVTGISDTCFSSKARAEYRPHRQKSFESNCLACHGIANGNFGPKLGGVHETRPFEDLMDFVKNSDAFVKKEDARTLALLDKYKNPMLGFVFSPRNGKT
jgi:mono/diheme cytochrome c family protein